MLTGWEYTNIKILVWILLHANDACSDLDTEKLWKIKKRAIEYVHKKYSKKVTPLCCLVTMQSNCDIY